MLPEYPQRHLESTGLKLEREREERQFKKTYIKTLSYANDHLLFGVELYRGELHLRNFAFAVQHAGCCELARRLLWEGSSAAAH